ncbi:TPA: tryptophan-rich sensory protein [Staphylococcus aureus]|nr:tryptophan-rich sensory protein [Staphylococcus aureus]
MTFKCLLKTIVKVVTPLLGGRLIGKYAVQNARKDYKDNAKPLLSPPGYIFPIVWSILYTTIGIAYAIISGKSNNAKVKTIYYAQLSLNYLWSILYFKFKLRFAALIESFILLTAVIMMTVKFFKVKRIAGIILIPYMLWSTFASYLTVGNWLLNKDNPRYTEQK